MDWNRFLPFGAKPATAARPSIHAEAGGRVFNGLDDPALLEYMRSGGSERAKEALFNTTAFRCCEVISGVCGALPFRPVRKDPNGKLVEDRDHPLYDVLNGAANEYQTGGEFRQLMTLRALTDGDAIARKVYSGTRIAGLLPLDNVTASLNNYGQPVYMGPKGQIPATEIFHLRGISINGINGLSRVRLAARAIGLSREAENAAINIFKGGAAPGGAITHSGKLSDPSFERLKNQIRTEYTGAENAGKWFLLEEGMTANPFGATGKDSQLMERSIHQVEEIARVFGGVPRPLLCVNDTTWGSGVEQLGILFVRFTMLPWFTAWEGRGKQSLLTLPERKIYSLDYDEQELLRGSMKDVGDFLAKVVGGNGNNGVLTQNEGRDMLGYGHHADGDRLAYNSGDLKNVPAQAS
ncbi:phage portal protein [Asticcacaulis sp.]|uniref:phage portal protein n=1 Tax=Asticcacaulis sp. TaxID=1872648 RepID=UPI003F7C0147